MFSFSHPCSLLVLYYTINTLDIKTEAIPPEPHSNGGPSPWGATFSVEKRGFFYWAWQEARWKVSNVRAPRRRQSRGHDTSKKKYSISIHDMMEETFSAEDNSNPWLFDFALDVHQSFLGTNLPCVGVHSDPESLGVLATPRQITLDPEGHIVIDDEEEREIGYFVKSLQIRHRGSKCKPYIPVHLVQESHKDAIMLVPSTTHVYGTTCDKIAFTFLALVATQLRCSRRDAMWGEQALLDAFRAMNYHNLYTTHLKNMEGYVPLTIEVAKEVPTAGGKKSKTTEQFPRGNNGTTLTFERPVLQLGDRVFTTARNKIRVIVDKLLQGKLSPHIAVEYYPTVCPIWLPSLPNFPWDYEHAWPGSHWTNKLFIDLDWEEYEETITLALAQEGSHKRFQLCEEMRKLSSNDHLNKTKSERLRECFYVWLLSELRKNSECLDFLSNIFVE